MNDFKGGFYQRAMATARRIDENADDDALRAAASVLAGTEWLEEAVLFGVDKMTPALRAEVRAILENSYEQVIEALDG